MSRIKRGIAVCISMLLAAGPLSGAGFGENKSVLLKDVGVLTSEVEKQRGATGDYDPQQFYNSVLHGILGDADYYTMEEYKDTVSVPDVYVGIGIDYSDDYDGGAIVYGILPGYPADQAGIRVDDRLMTIQGLNAAGGIIDQLDMIAEKPPGSYTIALERLGKPITLTVKSESITADVVNGRLLDNDKGYIYISNFHKGVGALFTEQLKALKAKGMKKLVLDLRSNNYGLISEMKTVAEQLLPKGALLYQIRQENGVQTYTITKGGSGLTSMVVLTDYDTAGEAAALAEALKRTGTAKLIAEDELWESDAHEAFEVKNPDGVLLISTGTYEIPGDTESEGQVIPSLRFVPYDDASYYISNLEYEETLTETDTLKITLNSEDYGYETQTLLQYLGLYQGEIDGIVNQKTYDALRNHGYLHNGFVTSESFKSLIKDAKARNNTLMIPYGDPLFSQALIELKSK